jgi:hypothetical protein
MLSDVCGMRREADVEAKNLVHPAVSVLVSSSCWPKPESGQETPPGKANDALGSLITPIKAVTPSDICGTCHYHLAERESEIPCPSCCISTGLDFQSPYWSTGLLSLFHNGSSSLSTSGTPTPDMNIWINRYKKA